jgi:MoaA/NifB/PqqE/SkfB family radical SAM enzyme
MDPVPFSRRHLDEANTASTFGSGEQIEIQLGHLCNNRCVFCVSGQMTEERIARLVPLDPIRQALEHGAARGMKRVTFLGGEPTIQRSFLPALALARELGYDDIVIFTNGVRLPQKGFVDQVLSHGDFTWRISIQGGNEEAHVDVTKRPASFARILEGMAILRDRGQEITANLCLNRLNAGSLPDFVPLVAEYGIRQLHVDLMRPQDAGARTDAYLLETMGRYREMAPAIEAMLEGFEASAPGFDVNIGNLPYCVLPGWSDRIHHGGQTTQTFAANGRGDIDRPWDKYAHQSSDKVHRDACDACAFRGRCAGVFDRYVEAFGWDEFQPLTLDELAAADPRQGAFDLLIVPALEPLLGAQPPPGWTLRERRHEPRERRLDLDFDGPGGTATLSFHPPPGRGRPVQAARPVLSGPRFRATLSAAGIPTAAQERLLDFVVATLDPHGAELSRRRLDEGPDRRALARLVQLVKRVKAEPAQGPWRLAGVQVRDDGVDLRWSGAGELTIRLRLGPGARAPRLEVVGDGLDPDAVRPLLARLQALDRPGTAQAPGGATGSSPSRR